MGTSAFDYIVIGAGSAGCVLANRLSADPRVTVLLLEAGGPDKKKEIHIPAGWPKLLRSDVDWEFFTEPQVFLNNRRLYWPRGKVLGGSSSLNALIFTRGNRNDYQDFDSIEAAFRRVEETIGVSKIRSGHPLSHAFVEACHETGLSHNDGFNGPVQEGAGFFRVSVREGKRRSAAVAYLAPAMSRPNLTVRTRALVSRINVENRRATGVIFSTGSGGAREEATARREVIVAAGAVQSPQVLLLSGIGPADHLRSVGVNVVHELPGVGRNLRDHLMGGVVHESTRPVSMADAGSLADILQYLLAKRGRLCSNIAEAGAFTRIDAAAERPDIELIFAPVFYMEHGFANPKGHGFSIGAVLLHPRSVGSIELRSSDPLQGLRINPQYLADEHDVHTLVEGVKLARQVAQAHAFDAYRGRELWPGDSVRTEASTAAWLRATAETLYHPVGTCRMGDDDMAVVDEQWRVRGLDGLRVVDASTFSAQITGHPNAAVMMCAEQAAAAILSGQTASV